MKTMNVRLLTALFIAVLAWFGTLGAFAYLSGDFTNPALGFSRFTLYYTNLAALMTAVVFTGIAFGSRRLAHRSAIGHVFVVMAILFLMYWYFQGVPHFRTSPLSQKVVHLALFPLVAVYWTVFRTEEPARWRYVLNWTVWPILYTAYGLLRGLYGDQYPYDQSDLEKLGYAKVFALIGLTIAFSMVVGSSLVVWDKWLAEFVYKAADGVRRRRADTRR